MKNVVFASAALLVLAGVPALAADMPLKAPVKAPVVVDPWSGFYVGGNAGYSWGDWDSTSIFNIFPTGAGVTATSGAGFNNALQSDFSTTASPGVNGWVAGGQFGVNKLYGSWLFGLEADIQATGEKAELDGSALILNTAAPRSTQLTITELNSWKLPWFATFRGRVGAVYDQTWLFYAAGGLAVARAEFSNTTTATIAIAGGGTATNTAFSPDGVTKPGFAIGGGIEKAIDAHWRVKAEYLYIDVGQHTFLAGSGIDTNVHIRDNIVRGGINYR